MFRRNVVHVLAAALVTAVAVGCTSTVGGTPTTASASAQDPVAWIDKVCGAAVLATDAAANVPDVTAGDLATTQRALSTYLANVIAALDRGQAEVDSAGPSPIEGGDQLAAKLRTTITKVRAGLSAEKTKLDAVPANDPSALALALVGIATALQDVSQSEPLADLNTNEKLRAAASESSNCRKLNNLPTGTAAVPVPLPTTTR